MLIIPFAGFREWLEGMGITEREDRFYWHGVIFRAGEGLVLHRRKGEERIELSRYLLVGREEAAML